MSIDKKAFGISDSLIQAVNEALKGNQHKIDVAEPKGKITGADFKKLRGEELIGGQKKLDKNHNGKLDKQDFKMLRKEEVVDEGNPANKAKKNAAAAAVGAQNRDAHHNAKRGMRTDVADKIRGREVMQGQPRMRHEEVEQMDELSTDTYHRAAHKAAKRAMGDVQGRSGPIFKKYAGMANKFRDKGMSQEKKEKAMKEETDPGFVSEAQRRADVKVVKVRLPDGSVTYKKHRLNTDVQNEATDDAVAKQIAAKKDAFKKQLQQKIAAKQMNTMQAKANKRLANIHASNSKCTCQEGKKSMSCEVCNGDKGMKGGKEQIIVNPPMREAAELPKKVITKGHEIAKSIIKHKGKVDNPYAVGMAAAKKSAGIKEEAEQVDEKKKAYEPDATTKARNPLVYGDKKKSNPLVYGDKHRDNPLVYGKKKVTKEEAEQVDEVLDSPIKKMAYIMKAKKSIEKSDPKKIKQANDIANRVIGIKRVMNKVNKKD